jgi:hypothetical protein
VLELALSIVDSIPAADGSESPRGRQELRKEIQAKFKDHVATIEKLLARFVPEALLPSPCGEVRNKASLRSPFSNLLECFDLCERCCAEARLAIGIAADRAKGGAVRREFLAPEIVGARITAAREEAEGQRRAELERRRFGPKFMSKFEDGQLRVWWGHPTERPAQVPEQPLGPQATPETKPPASMSAKGDGSPNAALKEMTEGQIRCAPDYSWLKTKGVVYSFTTPQQRAVISALLAQWIGSGGTDGCGLTVSALQGMVETAGDRLRIDKVFSDNSALNTILCKAGRGVWALYLCEPRPAATGATEGGTTKGPQKDH